jgi:hypothetical protein
VLASAALRFVIARTFDVPWISPDEMIYGLVGQSLWETGTLSVRGISVPYYSLLTPVLVGLPLTLDDLRTGVAVAQALQAVAMSLVAVPVYLWGKRLVGDRWAIAAAALAVLPPALWYGGLLMTEALFYTLVTAALVALARMLEEPTLTRQGTFLLLLSLAAAVRLQALVLLPALILAVGFEAWFGRSATRVRRLAPMLALVGLSAVVTIAAYGADRNDLLGAYATLAESAPSSTGALTQVAWHSGAIVVMTLVLPFLATATLAVMAAARTEQNAAVRSFLAVTTAYVVLLVAQVSAFAVGNLDHVSERYLVTAMPPLLLGMCVWIACGGPRPRRVTIPLAAASIALLATQPAPRAGTRPEAHDAFTILPLVEIAEPGEVAFRGALAAFGALVAIAFLLSPRRLLPAAAIAVAFGMGGLSVLVAREIDQFSRVEHADTFGDADSRWVDAVGASSILFVDTGERSSPNNARVSFWNRSIRRFVRLSEVEPRSPIPESPVDITDEGVLVDARGVVVSEPHVLVPATIDVVGEQLASSPPTEAGPGYGLWRVDEPLRLVSKMEAFSPVGDFTGVARVVVYRCSAGTLELTLLGKQGLPVRVTVNGIPWRTIQPAPGSVWRGSVPALPIPDGISTCVFELESGGLVGSTRVEWVPSGSYD